jgi:hypothetical protein
MRAILICDLTSTPEGRDMLERVLAVDDQLLLELDSLFDEGPEADECPVFAMLLTRGIQDCELEKLKLSKIADSEFRRVRLESNGTGMQRAAHEIVSDMKPSYPYSSRSPVLLQLQRHRRTYTSA